MLFQVVHDCVDAVGVPDEVVVHDEVIFLTREFPDAQISSIAKIALKVNHFKHFVFLFIFHARKQ